MFFCKATWSKVRAGDVVLMPWASLHEVVEITVDAVAKEKSKRDGTEYVVASFNFSGHHYPRWSFDPNDVAYVRSRL
jgi:hypothetical protein